MSRYLITTADQRTWKFDRPVLFLGEWCRYYDAKQLWAGMDAVVADPYGIKPDQKERNLAYVQQLFKQLLKDLTDALNAYHNTHHSLRYWHIVLGHWLYRYLTVTFNRYFTLEQALENYVVSGTTVLDSCSYSLATLDSMSFLWASCDDVWNHVLYSEILRFMGFAKVELVRGALQGNNCFHCPITEQGSSPKRVLLNLAGRILPYLSRKNDAFIIDSRLPFKEEVKLQICLGQIPQLWQSPELQPALPVPIQRKSLLIDASNHQGFEHFIRMLMPEVIPSCFVEGYKKLVDLTISLHWPTEPKFIITSNKFDTDEVFKAWVGSKVEKGFPYFVGQHGNYGVSPYVEADNNSPECATPDIFFTWGWKDEEPRNIPAFIFTTAGRKSQCYSLDGGLLLIELHVPQQLGPADDYYEFWIYQEEQFRFVEALSNIIQQKLTVRLHHAYKDLHWSDEQRWKDRSPHTRIEYGTAPIQKLIAQSRLVVHSYDSTGILETLALNIPTLCFWHGGLNHLLPSAKPYYELLRSAGIFHETPESAALKVAAVWDNASEWWESREVQDARKAFCNQYARTEKRPIRTLKRLLTEHANQRNGK